MSSLTIPAFVLPTVNVSPAATPLSPDQVFPLGEAVQRDWLTCLPPDAILHVSAVQVEADAWQTPKLVWRPPLPIEHVLVFVSQVPDAVHAAWVVYVVSAQ